MFKKNYRKLERNRIMTWTLMWLNWSVAIINATLQLLDIYRFEKKFSFSLPTSLEFLYTRLVKKDINLSYTLLCCISSPKFLGSTMN